jgi:hypothetical protein
MLVGAPALASPAPPAVPEPLPPPTAEELAAAAELDRRRNGSVTVRYNHYVKALKILGGELTAAAVDEELALSFVFKSCAIHLGRAGADGRAPGAGAAALAARVPERAPAPVVTAQVAAFASGGGGGGGAAGGGGEGGEEAAGCAPAVFSGLLDGDVLWVEVEEDEKEKAAADARQAAFVAKRGAVGDDDDKPKTEKVEGCRCVPAQNLARLLSYPTRANVRRTARFFSHVPSQGFSYMPPFPSLPSWNP